MKPFRLLALVLAVVFLVVIVQPARAEALEPTVIILIASAAIVVLALIVVVVVANLAERPGQSTLEMASIPAPLLERTASVVETPQTL